MWNLLSEILEARLRTCAQDADDVIHARMSKAADEMSHWAEYAYVVINREVLRAFEAVGVRSVAAGGVVGGRVNAAESRSQAVAFRYFFGG